LAAPQLLVVAFIILLPRAALDDSPGQAHRIAAIPARAVASHRVTGSGGFVHA